MAARIDEPPTVEARPTEEPVHVTFDQAKPGEEIVEVSAHAVQREHSRLTAAIRRQTLDVEERLNASLAAQFTESIPDVLDELTVVMVVIHNATLAVDTGERWAIVRAAQWFVIGFMLVFTIVTCLLAIGIGTNWPSCIGNGEPDDCPLGMACVHIQQTTGNYTRPLCNDCFYLADQHGSSHPWAHKNVAGPYMDEPNASRHCIEDRLFAPEYAFVQPDPADPETYTFEHCMYARLAYEHMSALDYIVLQLCFLIVALQVARDAKEQQAGSQLRQLCLPLFVPEARAGSLCALLTTVLTNLLESIYAKAVPALLPYAMLALVVSGGGKAENIILNGLSVVFVLELDTTVPKVFMSVQEQAEVKAFFAEVATRGSQAKSLSKQAGLDRTLSRASAPELRHGRASQKGVRASALSVSASGGGGSAGGGGSRGSVSGGGGGSVANERRGLDLQETHSAIKELGTYAFYTCLVSWVGLNVGFKRVTSPEAGVSCEMLVHYFFYRIGVQIGLWWLLLVRTVVLFVTKVPRELRRYQQKRQAASRAGDDEAACAKQRAAQLLKFKRRLTYLTFRHALGPFCETMAAALALCVCNWFASLIYFRISISYAADLYLGYAVTDIFGICANGVFGEQWGFPCIS